MSPCSCRPKDVARSTALPRESTCVGSTLFFFFFAFVIIKTKQKSVSGLPVITKGTGPPPSWRKGSPQPAVVLRAARGSRCVCGGVRLGPRRERRQLVSYTGNFITGFLLATPALHAAPAGRWPLKNLHPPSAPCRVCRFAVRPGHRAAAGSGAACGHRITPGPPRRERRACAMTATSLRPRCEARRRAAC